MSTQTRSLIAAIAGFAALGFFALSLIYWVMLANPPLRFDNIDNTLKVLLVAAIVAFTIYILVSPESVGAAAQKRSNRLTANALIASVVAVAIGIVVNILADSTVTARADWTAGQDFAISEQTVKILRDLESRGTEVQAIAFLSPSTDAESVRQAEELLAEYRTYTGKIRYELVDFVTNRNQALRYNVTRDGVVVFDNGTKQATANSISEREFTSALLKLSQTETRTVAFLSGHGEGDFGGADTDIYSQAKQSLEGNNYNVISWRLAVSPTITLDQVDVLVIGAPQEVIRDNEIAAIQAYLDSGGRAMIISDPIIPPATQASLNKLLAKYGATLAQGVVLDLAKNFQNSPIIVGVDTYPPNTITADLARRNHPTLFPQAQAVRPLTATNNLTVAPLIQTSSEPGASWLETDTTNPSVQFDPAVDIAGPVNIAVTIAPPDASTSVTPTTTLTETRLVVFGEAEFASNAVLSDQLPDYNLDLFANSISYLAGANELVSIRPKDPTEARRVTLDQAQKNIMFTASVLGLPLFVILAGGFMWWRRK